MILQIIYRKELNTKKVKTITLNFDENGDKNLKN